MSGSTRNALILLAVVGLGIVAAVFYTISVTEKRQEARPGNVYDVREDKELIRVVQTALSLEAVMTRLTTNDPHLGRPEVKYTLDEVSQIRDNLVEVRYRLLIGYSGEMKQIPKKKRFYKKSDGTWAAEPNS